MCLNPSALAVSLVITSVSKNRVISGSIALYHSQNVFHIVSSVSTNAIEKLELLVPLTSGVPVHSLPYVSSALSLLLPSLMSLEH